MINDDDNDNDNVKYHNHNVILENNGNDSGNYMKKNPATIEK